MVDSGGGVDVSVDTIKRENNQTILTIGINNHGRLFVDLQTIRAGWHKPTKYTVDTSASGGRHVSENLFTGNCPAC